MPVPNENPLKKTNPSTSDAQSKVDSASSGASAPENNEKRKNTHYLNMPDASPLVDARKPSMNTTLLSSEWRLTIRIDDKSLTIPLEDEIVIGRIIEEDSDTDIGLDLSPYGGYHFGVSRRHAVMTLHDGHLYLEDFGSTNGTRINGFQLTPKQKYRLRDSDEIEFARLRTIVRFENPNP